MSSPTSSFDPLGPVRVAQANTLHAIELQVIALNVQRVASYQSAFSDWASQVLAGRIPNTNPPAVPTAYEVSYFTDPTSGVGVPPFGVPVEWAFPLLGTKPACDPLPVPSVPVIHSQKGMIGSQLPTALGWFQCLAGDMTLNGETLPLTSADGIVGLFRKVASPFGSNPATGEVGGWWVKVG